MTTIARCGLLLEYHGLLVTFVSHAKMSEADWTADSHGPKKPCIRWIPDPKG